MSVRSNLLIHCGERFLLRSALLLVLAFAGILLTSKVMLAQDNDSVSDCRVGNPKGSETPDSGSGGGIITVPPRTGPGAGCGGVMNPCHEDVSSAAWGSTTSTQLKRSEKLIMDVQAMSPGQPLLPGAQMTVLLARGYPNSGQNLLEPLTVDGTIALYEVTIGEDGKTVCDFGTLDTLADSKVGGILTVRAVNEDVNSVEEFWQAMERAAENVGWMNYSIDNAMSIDEAAIQVLNHQRRLNLPVTLNNELPQDTAIDLVWRVQGQPLPRAQVPLQVGIYTTLLTAANGEGTLSVYAPQEFIVENFVNPIAPAFAEQFRMQNPYFNSGDYEIEVYVDGVLESIETITVP